MEIPFRPLPHPWHDLLRHNQYVHVGDLRYRFFYRQEPLVRMLSSCPLVAVDGPSESPSRLLLKAPHRTSESLRLTRFLTGAPMPEPNWWGPSAESQRDQWWQTHMAPLSAAQFVRPTDSGLLFLLSDLPLTARLLILDELSRLLLPELQDAWGRFGPFLGLIVIGRDDGRFDLAFTPYLESDEVLLVHNLLTGLPLDRLPATLCWTEGAIQGMAARYRPLPGVPETQVSA